VASACEPTTGASGGRGGSAAQAQGLARADRRQVAPDVAYAPPVDRPETLQELVEGLAEGGERPAVVRLRRTGTEELQRAQLLEEARRVARGLATRGINPGDAVAIFAPPGVEWIAALLGIVASGAVAVPVDAQLDRRKLKHVLADCKARLAFTTSTLAERLERSARRAKPLLLDADRDDERSWLALEGDGEPAEVSPDDVAAILYTSGTTGPPKGVPLTHANLAWQVRALIALELVREGDSVLVPLPLHHVYPLAIGVLLPLGAGAVIVLPHAVTGPQIARALREVRVTAMIGVPRLYAAFLGGLEARARAAGRLRGALLRSAIRLSAELDRRARIRAGAVLLGPLRRRIAPHLRLVASGGAALDPEVAWKLEGLGWRVATGYGLTETSPLLTLHPPGARRFETAGKPIEEVELKIEPVEPAEGERAADEGFGEVLARGPGVFAGYLRLPEKTEEAFSDGWFRTGDLGRMDEGGWLHLRGRASTRIVMPGGENVQPEDVEEVYAESPEIREVGVLEREGQLVALVVPRRGAHGGNGAEQDGGDVASAVRTAIERRSRELRSFERVVDFALTEEALPRTRLGKIERHSLEERYEQALVGKERPAGAMDPEEMSGEDRALLDDPAAREVWDALAQRYPDRRLTPDASPGLDLGIDSLEWIELSLEIGERSGVELSEEAIGRIETVRELLAEIVEAREGGAKAREPLEDPDSFLDDRELRSLEPRGPAVEELARACAAANRGIFRSIFRLEVEGLEHVPGEPPFVLAPNHASYLDAPALAAALPWSRLRETWWAGFTGITLSNPAARAFSRMANVVPFDVRRGALSSLAFASAVLQREHALVLFPEGRLSRDGELQEFKPGIGLLLAHRRVPVVPVWIGGTHGALPPGSWLPHPRSIRIAFGPPAEPSELEREGEGESPHERIASAVRTRVAALAEQSGAEASRA
jgi:long-chain acyl-CoA synthetase